jgi:hypothetical protein
LQDQAKTYVDLLHSDTAYSAGSQVLEAGCGVLTATNTLMAELAQDWSRPEGSQLLRILFEEVLSPIA